MRIIYQRPGLQPSSPEHARDIQAWLLAQGIDPRDVPSDSLIVFDTNDFGKFTLMWREYVRDGHRRVEEYPGVFQKTEWKLSPVDTAPPPFVALDMAGADL